MLFASLGVKEVITPNSCKKLLKSRLFSPHALKGQKLLAQGNALGYFVRKPVAL
jgi:hypothetical protein